MFVGQKCRMRKEYNFARSLHRSELGAIKSLKVTYVSL
jgi:hypothetical protein